MTRSQKRKFQQRLRRRLMCESLEDRRMLAGVVNVVWPGDGTLGLFESALTPGSDNQVQLQSTTNAGEYRVTGLNGTLVQLNGAGMTAPEVLVNAVFGDIEVELGHGSDQLIVANGTTIPSDLQIASEGVNDVSSLTGVSILGDLRVHHSPGAGVLPGSSPLTLASLALTDVSILGYASILNEIGNYNHVVDSTINGGLWVSKRDGTPAGASHLALTRATIVGPTIVTNVNGGGQGGDTSTSIVDSQLVGQTSAPPAGLPAAVPSASGRGLVVTNGPGNDKFDLLGSSKVGESPVLSSPQTVLTINNGDGGALTMFGPTSVDDANRVKVYGGVTIINGANVSGVLDMASLNQTDIVGMLAIYNAGGPGATSTMITNSNLGSFLAPAGPQLGSPVVVINDDGQDAFAMDGSTAWWGLFINNDDADGGTTPWPSNTSITNSNIGTRPGGPSNPGPGGADLDAALTANGIAGTSLPGLLSPGDALYVGGGMGNDVVNVNPTQIGGQVHLHLPGGNNSITMFGDPNNPLLYSSIVVYTGNGNDTLRLENIQIPVAIDVKLNGGNDRLELKGNTTLPDLSVGVGQINGGAGLDTLDIDDTVELPVNFIELLSLLTNFEF